MRIEILGTRGEIEESAPDHRLHSGILIDDTILLDVGEREFLESGPDWIFITHLHPDHAFFVNEEAEIKIPVYGPEDYNDVVTAIGSPQTFGSYTVIPIPTHHSAKVASVAYLVKFGEYSILYTGDIVWINREYHPLFDPVDLVITDGSYIRRGGLIRKHTDTGTLFGHNGIPDLIRLFAPCTGKVIFVHFGTWFFRDIAASEKKIQDLGKSMEYLPSLPTTAWNVLLVIEGECGETNFPIPVLD